MCQIYKNRTKERGNKKMEEQDTIDDRDPFCVFDAIFPVVVNNISIVSVVHLFVVHYLFFARSEIRWSWINHST